MAHVQKKTATRSDGTTRTWYRVRYLDTDGRERARDFHRKRDADAYRSTVETELRQGSWIDPDAGAVTLRRWTEQWLDGKRRIGPKTRASYAGLLRSWVWPALGDQAVARITRRDVERLVSEVIAAERSAATVRHVHRVLSMALTEAVEQRIVPRNVATGVELPRLTRSERDFLTTEQVDALAEAIDERYRVWVLVTTYGGLRFGESAALRKRHCDVLRRRLLVAESIAEVDGHLHQLDTKTHRAGSVTLPPFVTRELATHLEQRDGGEEMRVFTAPRGGPLRYRGFRSRIWDPAVKRAGLEGVTPHALRHTCAALMIAADAHPRAVQEQLRHSSIRVTMDVYGHLFDGDLDDVFARIEQLRDGVRDGSVVPLVSKRRAVGDGHDTDTRV